MLLETSRNITEIVSPCKRTGTRGTSRFSSSVHFILFSRQNLRDLSNFKGKGTKPRMGEQNRLGKGIRLPVGQEGDGYSVLSGNLG